MSDVLKKKNGFVCAKEVYLESFNAGFRTIRQFSILSFCQLIIGLGVYLRPACFTKNKT